MADTTTVKSRTFTLDELSKRADPEWIKDRNYTPAYKFGPDGKRKFIDHRDNVYQQSE